VAVAASGIGRVVRDGVRVSDAFCTQTGARPLHVEKIPRPIIFPGQLANGLFARAPPPTLASINCPPGRIPRDRRGVYTYTHIYTCGSNSRVIISRRRTIIRHIASAADRRSVLSAPVNVARVLVLFSLRTFLVSRSPVPADGFNR